MTTTISTASTSGCGHPARHRRRGAVLEQAILDATIAELVSVGYAALTMEAVAAHAHTGKTSLYRRWPQKVDLVIDAILSRLNAPDAQSGLQVLEAACTTRQALLLVGQWMLEFIEEAGEAIHVLGCEARRDEELSSALRDRLLTPKHALVRTVLERGQARGEVRADADLDMIALVLPAVLAHQMLVLNNRVGVDEVARVVDTVVMPLVATSAAQVKRQGIDSSVRSEQWEPRPV